MESITRYVTDHGSSISVNSEAFVVFALHMMNQMKASNINILKCGMENLLAIAKNCPMGKRSCLLIVPCVLTKVGSVYEYNLDPRQEVGFHRKRSAIDPMREDRRLAHSRCCQPVHVVKQDSAATKECSPVGAVGDQRFRCLHRESSLLSPLPPNSLRAKEFKSRGEISGNGDSRGAASSAGSRGSSGRRTLRPSRTPEKVHSRVSVICSRGNPRCRLQRARSDKVVKRQFAPNQRWRNGANGATACFGRSTVSTDFPAGRNRAESLDEKLPDFRRFFRPPGSQRSDPGGSIFSPANRDAIVDPLGPPRNSLPPHPGGRRHVAPLRFPLPLVPANFFPRVPGGPRGSLRVSPFPPRGVTSDASPPHRENLPPQFPLVPAGPVAPGVSR